MNERGVSASAEERPKASVPTTGLTALFAVTACLSSALAFIVELMFAKMVLPLLGGTPAVWNTCVVFFQTTLLAGYAYAHFTTTRLTVRQQAVAHGVLLLLASLTLPVTLPAGWIPPVDTTPIVWLVLALTIGVGAPFLMVSATAPLVQKWFAGTDHPSAKDPYFLYSASNLGSILALAGYPFVIEPMSSLPQQVSMWTVGYVAFSVLTVACGAMSLRRAAVQHDVVSAPIAGDNLASGPSWRQRGGWFARSLVPSSLLLGITTYLSTDIASVPLLWAVPLTLYLLSFVLAFAPAPLVPPRRVARAMPLLVLTVVVFIAAGARGPIQVLIPLHLMTFFVCALHLHTAIASRRPDTRQLTEFYFWIAAGGVAGGFFNAFLAPLLFTGIVEYPAALVAACLLQPWPAGVADSRLRSADFTLPLAVGIVTAVTYAFSTQVLQLVSLFLVTALAMWCLSFSRRPVRFGLALGMMLLAADMYQRDGHVVIAADRTFFGVVRVRANESLLQHVLLHGNTIHGEQRFTPTERREPLAYYHESGPIGDVIRTLSGRLHDAHVGVVGLGAGSLAAYAQSGQRWTFYEIDPAVVRIARDPRLFTYLQHCGAACEIVLGDARLSLARAARPLYRLLVLDAFSSDAIPVHLMTREALDLYLGRLESDGVIAFHISNRHLHLRPVLAALAAEKGLAALAREDRRPPDSIEEGVFPSHWFLMARRPHAFGPLVDDPRWQRPAVDQATRVWTDDYSNILAVLGSR